MTIEQLDTAVERPSRSYWQPEQEVPAGTTLSELFSEKRPDLDFRVDKRELAFHRGRTEEGELLLGEMPRHVATVRVNPDSSELPLGVVGVNYSVVQNADAFAVCEYVAGEAGAEYVAAGVERDGAKVWAVMKLPPEDGRPLRIAGDLVDPFMVFATAHDGSHALAMATTPVRFQCTNAIPWGSDRARRIRHTGNMKAKLDVARQLIRRHRDYMSEFARLADQLALRRATPRELASWVDAMYPINRKKLGDRAIRSREDARLVVEHLTNHAPNLEGHHGTGYAFVNAVAEYTDWYSKRRRNQMGPLLGGVETKEKNKAVRIVLDSPN